MKVRGLLQRIEELTRPVDDATRRSMEERWLELPEAVRTPSQAIGRHGVGCEGTHGVFPRCNFACTPCYHSADANQVRVDGEHTLQEVEAQMNFLEQHRGPRAHAQLIGGEVSLLSPEDHASALSIMRSHGREPMSFTHGDIDYDYLKKVALDAHGKARFKRISFAGHFDTTMRGRRGLRTPTSEAELNPYRQRFCEYFERLKKETGTSYYLAHNMTITPDNVGQIADVLRDCSSMGFSMFSFQPAAYIGNDKRWKGAYRELSADDVWAEMERGVGSRLVYKAIQVGDERCNRTAWGFYVGSTWHSILDDRDPRDMEARDAFYRYLGGVHFNAPLPLLALRLGRIALSNPKLLLMAFRWVFRTLHRVGGVRTLLKNKVRPMTFVMHRFMDAAQVNPAWELMEQGIVSDDPAIAEVQERLKACSYAMAHPETGRVVPACVQHGVLDPQENLALKELLPLPRRRERTSPPDIVTTARG